MSTGFTLCSSGFSGFGSCTEAGIHWDDPISCERCGAFIQRVLDRRFISDPKISEYNGVRVVCLVCYQWIFVECKRTGRSMLDILNKDLWYERDEQ